MADSKISGLTGMDGTAGNIPIAGDLVPIVDSSAAETKNIDFDILTGGVINVISYGADKTGVADSTAAINAAVAAANVGDTVYFPNGTYKVTSTVNVTTGNVHFAGESPHGTIINFAPSAADTCFSWTLTQGLGGIKNIWFQSTDTTYAKTAINFIDVSDFHISGVRVGHSPNYWGDVSESSIGIQGNGREVVSISRVRIFADKPIVFGQNPNHANLDCDQFHLYDTYLVVNANVPNAHIEILDDTQLFNFTIDGYNAWARGRYGIYWNATTNATSCFNVKFSNIRFEQGYEGGGTGYIMYIVHDDFLIQQLQIENVYGSNTLTDGYYIKGAQDILLKNVLNPCDGTALEVVHSADGDTQSLNIINCALGSTGSDSVLPSNLLLVEGNPSFSSTVSLPENARYSISQSRFINYGSRFSGQNIKRFEISRTLLAPQNDATSDVTFSASGKTITTAGALDFTGILQGDTIYVDDTTTNDGHKTVAEDASATVITVNESLTDQTPVSTEIVHGFEFPSHRGNVDGVVRTSVSAYLSGEASGDAEQHVMVTTGKAGDVSNALESDSAIFDVVNVGSSSAPTADKVTLTASTQPMRLFNNRTSASSDGKFLIEQLYW